MTQTLKLVLGVVGLIAVLAIAGIAHNLIVDTAYSPPQQTGQTPAADPQDRTPAPDFAMLDREGNTLQLSDMKGRPIVLSFWTSWCPACSAGQPGFNTVYAELGGQVQFVMLNLTDGRRETMQSATGYLEEHGYTFPVFFDTEGNGARAYGVRSLPTTVFIDRDGYVAATFQGFMNIESLRREIDLIRE